MKMMKQLLVLGTQRTGSSAVAKLINLHPDILCGLEWTNRAPMQRKMALARELLACDFRSLEGFDREYVSRKSIERLSWIGFKILFSSSNKWIIHPRYSPALWFDRLNGHLRWIRGQKHIHVIHIVRNDNMEWLKSVFLAKATQMFSGKNYPEGYRIRIDPNNAIARLISKKWVDERIATLQSTNPYCRIEYEEFKNDNRRTAENILNFLNMSTSLDYGSYNAVRQSKSDAREYISNYEDLRRAMKRRNLL